MRYTISLVMASLLAAAAVRAEGVAVVADVPPVHSLVAMVMGDMGLPVLLLDRGADAHDFQLRPSQAQAVAAADVIIWVGPEMSPWLGRAVEGLGTAAPQLVLLSAAGTATRSYGGHDDDGHDHGGVDPHAWLDPGNAALWVDAIAAELARLDPANAAAYAANAASARVRIAGVAAAAADRLAPAQGRPMIVAHDAYGYFADHFGLTLRPIAGGSAAAPGAAGLHDLVGWGGHSHVACVFPEANHDAGLAEQVAADTGARLGGALDPEGAGMVPGPELYPALLTGLADAIADCVAP